MAEAMLIMEMPKCCALCELYYNQVGLPKCTATWRIIDSKNTEVRQEWCPLREVPQKPDYPPINENSYVAGYNACIDEILGGGE